MNTYIKGQVARLTGTFKNLDGELTDPTTITLTVTQPDGTTTTTLTYAAAQLTKDSTGVFHYDLATAQKGIVKYRWDGTGAVAAATEGAFYVRSDF